MKTLILLLMFATMALGAERQPVQYHRSIPYRYKTESQYRSERPTKQAESKATKPEKQSGFSLSETDMKNLLQKLVRLEKKVKELENRIKMLEQAENPEP